MKGTADEKTMLNYYNNTIVPVVSAIVNSMKWKFLTKTARTRHHSIMYFRDPFKNTPISQIAEMTDKFTRNEMRAVLGWKPVDDPRADELRNKNLNQEAGAQPMFTEDEESAIDEYGQPIDEEVPDNSPMDMDLSQLKLSELVNL